MLRTKSLLKYNTAERFSPEVLTPEPGKRRVNIRIDTPTIGPKASPKSVVLKGQRRTFEAEGSKPQLPNISRCRKLTLGKSFCRTGTQSPSPLSRSKTPTPMHPTARSPLPSPHKFQVPRFEEKGLLGVVGNCTVAQGGAEQFSMTKGKAQAEMWQKELHEFIRSVEKRATDWYEELDYEGKGFITRQDILDKLRLQKYISPRFQYLDHKKAFFGEDQKESTFNSIKCGQPQITGNTDRMIAETEDTYVMLNTQKTDRLTKTDIASLVCVFEFNSTSKHQRLDLLSATVLKRLAVQLRELKEIFDCYTSSEELLPADLEHLCKVFERDNIQVDPIRLEICEQKVDFSRFLLYLPFFMRLHFTVIKSLRI